MVCHPLSSDTNQRLQTNADAFFGGSSFSVLVAGQDLDQSLSTTPIEPTSDDLNPDGPTELPVRPFSCECSPWCTKHLYHPLPPGNAIRILEVMPGTHESPLICTLHLATFPQAINSYSALSYAWQVGFHPRPPQTIICNGREVQIGENLFDALRRVRHPTSSQMIWADALCINQEDVEERSMQVAKMGDIFHSAHQVLVWLGREDKRVGWRQEFSVVSALSDLCTIVNTWRENSRKESHTSKARFYHRSPNGGLRVVADCAPDERSRRFGYNRFWWTETLQLFERRWFHRVWVIQEVALARAVRVLLGEYEISWDVIGLAASILRSNFNTLVPTTPHRYTRKILVEFRTGVLNAYFMYRLSRSQSHTERMRPDFHQLLILTRSFDCQDDRDRIYGLIGLPFSRSSPSAGHSPFIIPDYSKTTAEVYLEVATKLLRESHSLRLLSSVQRPSPRSRPEKHGTFSPETPSWVPQWTFSETQSLTPFETASLPPAPMEIIPPKLRVRGFQVTTVSTTSPVGIRADFCIPWWILQTDPDIIIEGIHNGERVRYPLEPTGDITDEMLLRNLTETNLTEVAMVLTGGNDWRGRPVADKTAHAKDFAKLLLDGGLLWTLEDGLYATPEEEPEMGWEVWNRWRKYGYRKSLTEGQMELLSENLGAFAREGNPMRFLDAAGTVGKGRRRFQTDSGLRGIGPGAMEVGDSVCVLRGSSAPFVLRRNGEGNEYEVVGECFLYVAGFKEGEGLQDALERELGGEEGWLGLV